MMQIESIRCRHKTLIEDADAPEMCCAQCFAEIDMPLCHSCLYSDRKVTWCAKFVTPLGWTKKNGRAGVTGCSEYAERTEG